MRINKRFKKRAIILIQYVSDVLKYMKNVLISGPLHKESKTRDAPLSNAFCLAKRIQRRASSNVITGVLRVM